MNGWSCDWVHNPLSVYFLVVFDPFVAQVALCGDSVFRLESQENRIGPWFQIRVQGSITYGDKFPYWLTLSIPYHTMVFSASLFNLYTIRSIEDGVTRRELYERIRDSDQVPLQDVGPIENTVLWLCMLAALLEDAWLRWF